MRCKWIRISPKKYTNQLQLIVLFRLNGKFDNEIDAFDYRSLVALVDCVVVEVDLGLEIGVPWMDES